VLIRPAINQPCVPAPRQLAVGYGKMCTAVASNGGVPVAHLL
jgi:hypothetical protein